MEKQIEIEAHKSSDMTFEWASNIMYNLQHSFSNIWWSGWIESGSECRTIIFCNPDDQKAVRSFLIVHGFKI